MGSPEWDAREEVNDLNNVETARVYSRKHVLPLNGGYRRDLVNVRSKPLSGGPRDRRDSDYVRLSIGRCRTSGGRVGKGRWGLNGSRTGVGSYDSDRV